MTTLKTVYLYLTNACNLKCQHCWIIPGEEAKIKNDYLEIELFEKVLTQAKQAGAFRIKLTGGEPLLHPKIYKILERIREEEFRLAVETNGTLVNEKMTEELVKCNPFVAISLDAADANLHDKIRGVQGAFKKTVNGIKNLVSNGIKPQIIFTLMKENSNQVEKIAKLAERLGASSLKINVLQRVARAEKLYEGGQALTVEEYMELGKKIYGEITKSAKIKIFYDVPMAFQPVTKIYQGESCGLCGICSIIGVLANGSYALCGIGEHIPELVFGNVKNDKLADIWKNNKTIQKIQNDLVDNLQGICSSCLFKSACLGKCLAQNYYDSKNLFASYWFCEQAHEKGLFPVNRKL